MVQISTTFILILNCLTLSNDPCFFRGKLFGCNKLLPIMSSNLVSTLCNIGYDILTILISIADVATDIIVLIDFYNKERMAFFWISFSILILAQCSYSIACGARFNTLGSWEWGGVAAFCCCLPFGTFAGSFV